MTNYLKHYKEAKKNGWEPDKYKATITLINNNSKVSVDFTGNYFDLLLTIIRYKSFNMTSEWHVLKNGVEVNMEELLSYFDEADRILARWGGES